MESTWGPSRGSKRKDESRARAIGLGCFDSETSRFANSFPAQHDRGSRIYGGAFLSKACKVFNSNNLQGGVPLMDLQDIGLQGLICKLLLNKDYGLNEEWSVMSPLGFVDFKRTSSQPAMVIGQRKILAIDN